jgi:hypothetical protein
MGRGEYARGTAYGGQYGRRGYPHRITFYYGRILTREGGRRMIDDAIVLWGLLLVYGIPICAIAYWMERMINKGEDDNG